MANEQDKTKKPPAHEVIVARLKWCNENWRRTGIAGSPYVPEEQRSRAMYGARELILLLARMHIPEQARADISAFLRTLDPILFPDSDATASGLFAEIEGTIETHDAKGGA